METDSIPCFNTSHVTLYPTSGWDLTSPVTFQYISCYSLSEMVKFDYYAIYMFQYISCYSLSLRPQENIPCQTRFNTSHVTLYPEVHPVSDPSSTFQYISCYSLSLCWCAVLRITFGFNTSHVTLYRYYANLIRQMKRVSIHLMLLFIQ